MFDGVFTGTWINERSGAMILEQNRDEISGRYVTAIGNSGVVGKGHRVVGMANGSTIGLVVAWPSAGSLTSWAGRIEVAPDGSATLHTMWHLVRSAPATDPSKEVEIWESFLTNSSVFRRTSAAARQG